MNLNVMSLMKLIAIFATCLWLSGCIFPPDGRYGDHRYDQHDNNGQGYSDHDHDHQW